MSKYKILVVWSNYYQELSERQLESCLQLLNQSDYSYHVETVEAGTYEIPAVIRHYHHTTDFNAYLPLSLLSKGGTDHYEFILDHIKASFTELTLEGLIIGNGIISAPNIDVLTDRVTQGERVKEAFRAIDYLIRLKHSIT
jgi:6,7-dimethyl-8-ribityllumazine synthase